MDRLRDSSLDFQVPVYFVEEFYDFVNNEIFTQSNTMHFIHIFDSQSSNELM